MQDACRKTRELRSRVTGSGTLNRILATLFVAAGILGLVFLAREKCQVAAYQTRAAEALTAARIAAASPGLAGPVRLVRDVAPDTGLARIDIARIGIAAMIAPGDDSKSLRRGVGFIAGTARLGETGNVGLAGHRDTFFRNLRRIEVADTILITTSMNRYRYIVDWKKIVDPGAVAVLAPVDSAQLTLVTCYPFHYVGPAPQRFVVRARRLDSYAGR